MKIKLSELKRHALAGYTLIETLVASSILMFGIGAAASMSLTLLTVEEINERTVRAMNYLENAADLHRLGFSEAEIKALLPDDPVVVGLTFTTKNQTVTNLGSTSTTEITIEFTPAEATSDWTEGSFTSGEQDVTRKHTIEVFRASQYVTP